MNEITTPLNINIHDRLCFIGVIISFSSVACLVLSLGMIVIGVVLYHANECARANGLCEFEPLMFCTRYNRQLLEQQIPYTAIPDGNTEFVVI